MIPQDPRVTRLKTFTVHLFSSPIWVQSFVNLIRSIPGIETRLSGGSISSILATKSLTFLTAFWHSFIDSSHPLSMKLYIESEHNISFQHKTTFQTAWMWPPPSNSGKWRFIGIPYWNFLNPGGDCYWAGGQPKVYHFNIKQLSFTARRKLAIRTPHAARLAFLLRKMKVSWSWKRSQRMARAKTDSLQDTARRDKNERSSIFAYFFPIICLIHWSMILSCFLNEREGLSTVMKHSTSILRRCQELSYELNTAEQLLFKRRETRAWQRCGLEVHWKPSHVSQRAVPSCTLVISAMNFLASFGSVAETRHFFFRNRRREV